MSCWTYPSWPLIDITKHSELFDFDFVEIIVSKVSAWALYTYYSRVEWFSIFKGPQFQHLIFLMSFFNLAPCCCVDCYTEIIQYILFYTRLLRSLPRDNVFFNFWKAMKRNSKISWLLLCPNKRQFCLFWGSKDFFKKSLVSCPGGLDSWRKKCRAISWHCHFN